MPNAHADARVVVHHGDALEALKLLPDASVHAVVTDPPYALDFMGHGWDRHATPAAFSQWCELWGRECARVLIPGGHLLAFGSPRTWHRLAVGLEDAGLELRDSIAWLHAQGFPKGRGVLKPAFEPVVVARKGRTGGLYPDAARIGSELRHNRSAANASVVGMGTEGSMVAGETAGRPAVGRWPANAVLDEHAAAQLELQLPGAARFFYVAKAGRAERPVVAGVSHPTVKPLAVMRHLLRLVVPPGGIVLEPFAGSGATVEAALLEGFRVVAIEREADYVPLILQRIARQAAT